MRAGGLGRWRVHGEQVCGSGFRLARFASVLLALVNAGGAGASIAQPGEVPRAVVAVRPLDLEALALGDQHPDFVRDDGLARKGLVQLRLTRHVVLCRNTDAFMTHDYILQGGRHQGPEPPREARASPRGRINGTESVCYALTPETCQCVFQKYQPDMAKPMAMMSPRSTDWGIWRASRAEA